MFNSHFLFSSGGLTYGNCGPAQQISNVLWCVSEHVLACVDGCVRVCVGGVFGCVGGVFGWVCGCARIIVCMCVFVRVCVRARVCGWGVCECICG